MLNSKVKNTPKTLDFFPLRHTQTLQFPLSHLPHCLTLYRVRNLKEEWALLRTFRAVNSFVSFRNKFSAFFFLFSSSFSSSSSSTTRTWGMYDFRKEEYGIVCTATILHCCRCFQCYQYRNSYLTCTCKPLLNNATRLRPINDNGN